MTDSRAGGAAPHFAKARANLGYLGRCADPCGYSPGYECDQVPRVDEACCRPCRTRRATGQLAATLDQAEFEIARLREENAAARCEALALFNAMDHGPAEPLDTVAGIISQISNMVAGLRPPVETPQSREQEYAGITVEWEEYPVISIEWVKAGAKLPSGDQNERDLTLIGVDGTVTNVGVGDRIAYLRLPSVSPSVPQEELNRFGLAPARGEGEG